MERKAIKSEQLRNEASLNCASLRSRVHYAARRGLSRVEMNALRALLTALSAPVETCCHFLHDTADAFIDGRLFLAIQAQQISPGNSSLQTRRSIPRNPQGSRGRHVLSCFDWHAAPT